MELDSRQQLHLKLRKYYAFNAVLYEVIQSLSFSNEDYFERACWTCFHGYCQSGISYFFSVYDDLNYEEYSFLPKAAANRILLRNCIEANLLLTVFINKPHLATKYYSTLPSDQERIEGLYTLQAQEDADEADEGMEKKRFIKRFSWLPRIKGKKANTMNDLLNYVDFDSDAQKDYYRIIIRNFDTYIHPSFHFAKAIAENYDDGNVDNILAMFIDEGLLYESAYNVLSALHDVYQERIPINAYRMLETLLSHDEVENASTLPLPFRHVMEAPEPLEDDVLLATAFHTFHLQQAYQKQRLRQPEQIQGVAYIIGMSSLYVQRDGPVSFKGKYIGYLLQDLSPRYDDLLSAFYQGNAMMFYAQARYIIEAMSILNLLSLEDNNRAFIYGVHQKIKGYEAKASAIEFLRRNIEQIEDAEDANLARDYQRDIQIVQRYYRDLFQQDIEETTILRLNGWALYLKGKANDQVPNSPYFVHMLAEIMPEDKVESVTAYLLGFYEESNAFTHVTPYAFDQNAKDERMTDAMMLINELMRRVMLRIIDTFSLLDSLTKTEAEELERLFFFPLQQMKQMYGARRVLH
jgi:hypothetical protein